MKNGVSGCLALANGFSLVLAFFWKVWAVVPKLASILRASPPCAGPCRWLVSGGQLLVIGGQSWLTADSWIQRFPLFKRHPCLVRVPLVPKHAQLFEFISKTDRNKKKPMKLGGIMVGNIRPMCFNLGHSCQVFCWKLKPSICICPLDLLQDHFWMGMGYIDTDWTNMTQIGLFLMSQRSRICKTCWEQLRF